MTFSKLSLLVAAVALVGCSTESNKKKDILVNSPYDYEQTGNFQVSTFRVMKSERAAANSFDFVSMKTFNFEACLVDQLNAPIGQPNLAFVVADEQGNEEEVRTDRRGCVVWSETPKISYLLDETYFKIVRVIKSKSYYKGYVKVEGAFMPWYDDGASLVDTRYNKLPDGTPVDQVSTQTLRGAHFRPTTSSNVRVNLKSASFKFAGLDEGKYEITPLLGLKVAHKYQVRLTPTVIRKTLKKTVVPEALNTGSMKAILVILKEVKNSADQFKVDNVVTSVEFEDNLLYGDLMADISIPFPNVVDITSRTVALITLIPKEELEGLPSMSFAGPLSPGLLSSLELRPVAHNALSLHQQFQENQKRERQLKARSFDIFKKLTGYKTLNVAAPVEGGWFREDSSLKAELYEQFSKPNGSEVKLTLETHRTLCDLMFPKSLVPPRGVRPAVPVNQACRLYPNNYLQMRMVRFVEQFHSNVPRPVGIPTVDTLTMAASFSATDTFSQSAGANAKLGLSFSKSAPIPLPSINFSVGADYSVGRVRRMDRTTSTSINRTRTVTAEGVTFAMDVTTRKCFVVESSDLARNTYPGETAGLYYCSEKLERNPNHLETYYLLTSKSGVDGSPITDNASNASSPWKVMIRGTQMMNAFAEVLQKPFYQFALSPVNTNTEDKLYSSFKELYMNQDFPGVLSEPEAK